MPFNYVGQNVSRSTESSVYPIQVIGDSGNVTRCGPLITPDELRLTYLLGVPLTVPTTKQSLNNENLKTFINRALNEAETLLGITIVETVRESRIPYDRSLSNYWFYVEFPFRPITMINQFSIQTSNDSIVYQVPADWIEVKNAALGQLSIGWSTTPGASPILSDGFYGNAAVVLLRNMGIYNTPGFWTISCVTGFPLDKIPSPIGQLIATIASIDILSMLGPVLRPTTGQSLSIDGLAQSTQTPGPQWLLARVAQLTEKRDSLVTQIRSYYYNQIYVSNF